MFTRFLSFTKPLECGGRNIPFLVTVEKDCMKKLTNKDVQKSYSYFNLEILLIFLNILYSAMLNNY